MVFSREQCRARDSDRPANAATIGQAAGGQRLRSLLVVDGDPAVAALLRQGLTDQFSLIEGAADTGAASDLLQRCHFDLIVADTRLPDRSGIDWVASLREAGQATPVILTATHADLDTAIGALRAGSADLVPKPFSLDHIRDAIGQCLNHGRRPAAMSSREHQAVQADNQQGIVGSCDLIRSVCEVIERVAPMPSTVLIQGESGTGKELAARAIHRFSGRRGSFVPINCGAMTAELLESELYGHAKGAFTGAVKARDGLFSYANGGTLFLDEISEMPLAMQTRLLRVMEDHCVRPVGGNREMPIDVRILTATNRDLKAEVDAGRFRADLFYRLNVLSVRMPALRERLEDIPELVSHFVSTIAVDLGVPAPAIPDVELQRLTQYDWPGNIRELKNTIERCLLLNHQPSETLPGCSASLLPDGRVEDGNDLLLATVERRHILRVLEMEGGNKSAAARVLGVSRKTLERKCHAWGVNRSGVCRQSAPQTSSPQASRS